MKPTTEAQFANVRAIAIFAHSIRYNEYNANNCPVREPVTKANPGCILAHAFHARKLSPAVMAHIDKRVGIGCSLNFHGGTFSKLLDADYGNGANTWFYRPPANLDEAIRALDTFAGGAPSTVEANPSTYTFKSNPDGSVDATRTTVFKLADAAAMLQFIKENGITP